MENHRIIDFEEIENKIQLNIDNFNLYLNSVGGHSLFIEISRKYLIKSSNESEINFYCFINQNKKTFHANTIPNFKGVIRQKTKYFKLIENYVNQCKTFFRNYLNENKINAKDIDIEKDIKFNEIFNSFLKEKDIYTIYDLNPSFKKLKENLNGFSKEKLKWILFSFVKWRENFLKNDFLVLENLTYEMQSPAIIDIKLGSAKKFSKENHKEKTYEGASNKIGCRIMGIQKGEIFKNRYYTRNLSEEYFQKEIFEFFKDKKELVKKTFEESQYLIKEVKQFDMEFKYSSLLIAYDDKDESINAINLIDFSFFEKGTNTNDSTINLIKSIENFIEILKKIR